MKRNNKFQRIIATIASLLSILVKAITFRIMGRKIIYVMGTSTHSNIGDLAISEAEISFVAKKLRENAVIDVPASGERSMRLLIKVVQSMAKVDDIFVLQGGGNMGDVYAYEENSRKEIIKAFPQNRIIVFPQTMYFSKTESGHAALNETAKIYAHHNSLTIFAREPYSYKQMLKHFKNNKVLMIPDIVLSMSVDLKKRHRSGILLCLRNDVEKTLSSQDMETLGNWTSRLSCGVKYTDMIAPLNMIPSWRRKKVIQGKLEEFNSAGLVITDRLHGMIFAVISGTPCIVLANYNHKVVGVYGCLKDLEYIQYCSTTKELTKSINSLDLSNQYTYSPEYFRDSWDKLAAVIKAGRPVR